MRRLHSVLFVTAVACSTAFVTNLLAEEATTAAAAAKVAATVIPPNDGKWHTVLTTVIKNPTATDDLFLDVSQVNRITTTDVSSSATPSVISSGDAQLMMRVLVDGTVALPGPIVFDEQVTSLTANLQRFLSLSCTQTTKQNVIVTTSCVCNRSVGGDGAISCLPPPDPVPVGFTRSCTSEISPDPDVVTTCALVPGANETLATLLSETIAHSYDFLAIGVGGMGDTHTIQVQEMLRQTTTSGGTVSATIGPQTLKVLAVDLKPTQ